MSLDRRPRTALVAHLKAAPTGAKDVVTYVRSAFRPDQLPVINLEIGSWGQRVVGKDNVVGSRLFARDHDVVMHLGGVPRPTAWALGPG